MKKSVLFKRIARTALLICLLALAVCCMASCDALNIHIFENHTYTTETTEPTCTEKGYTTYTCSCGDTYVEEIDALGHEYNTVVTDPTCSEQGYSTHTCKRCKNKYIDNYTDSLGHSLGEWVVVISPTCEENGLEERLCECGEKEGRIIEETGHSFSSWTIINEPTCSEDGLRERSCHCGKIESEIIDATGHSFSDWTIVKEPTCTEEGLEERTCECGEKETNTLSTIDHIEGEWVYRSNNTEYHLLCSVCGSSIKIEYHDHKWGEWVLVKEATCTKYGINARSCICGATEESFIDPQGHTESDWITDKEPNCTELGSKHIECTICHEGLNSSDIPALGHAEGIWTLNDGFTHIERFCTLCGEKLSSIELTFFYEYELNEDKTSYSIIGIGEHKLPFIVTPSMYNGLPVTGIGDEAFYGCDFVTDVYIIGNIETIGAKAFANCYSLKNVTIGEQVKTLGNQAFLNCSNLTKINFNAIEMDDFSANHNLLQGAGTVAGIDLVIGNKVTAIPAFFAEITTYDQYGNVSSYIGANIKGIYFEEGSSCERIGYWAFCFVVTLENFELPDSLKTIEGFAFKGCTSLTSVTIPKNVTTILSGAFEDCTSLTNLNFNATAMDDLEYKYRIFNGCVSLTDVTFGRNVTKVPAYLFDFDYYDGYLKLKNVKFESGSVCESIGESAFSECIYSTTITLPDSLKVIEMWAFSACKLETVSIPNSVTTIGMYAFYDCPLVSVSIPNSIEKVGTDAFSLFSGTNRNIFTIYENGYYLGNSRNPYLVLVFGGAKTKTIHPDTIVIADNAFNATTYGLTSITIGGSVKYIGEEAFSSCTVLRVVTIENSVVAIGDFAFRDCSNLTSVTIGDSVTSIGNGAFSSCKSLTSITIPDSVTSIGNGAFYCCTSLTSINFDGTIEQWNAISKSSVWDASTGTYTIYCTDGTIAKDGTVTYN